MRYNESVRNILATTQFLLPSLTPAEKRVGEFILDSPKEASSMSLQKMAKRCKCGEATVVRLCKTVGASGYSEFKQLLRKQISNPTARDEVEYLESSHDIGDIVESVFRLNILNLKKTLEVASFEEYESACEAIASTRKICFFAIGDAMFPCSYAGLRFRRMGYDCYADSDADIQIVNACNMKPGDVAIAISHSGRTKQVVEAMRIAKERGARTICITKAGKSELTKYSDIVLYNVTMDSSVDKEVIARRVAEQAMLDAIYMGALQRMETNSFARLQEVSSNLRVNKIPEKNSQDR
ncbi:MurR/RpiR family transcriptional regulator [Hespellia stercorisuis]|uniref:Transcriptional regulator, RpiR family n=1 Tax=Hespellia stercorisuis DSM 15480 TaxID=1121950 RepID=A0A1M6J6N7_9FIRM|nr:MurR/RpiR family transcriptional regulator [Hespellia stercorisuis]SHJ42315.1 transcriptional regulator, RpiR family [Hespellia stercorisuis DSM 15480]